MNSATTEKVDAAVVGCGPAGGLLAGRLARDGFRVVAIEKRPMVGLPVRCGEAAGSREEISHFIPVDESWIVADINAARMYAPNGTYVEKRLPGVGLMLKRDGFDQALAEQARSWGAEVRTYHEATGLVLDEGRVAGVNVTNHATKEQYTLKARVTIGADGVEGFVGRWANLTKHLRPREIHSAVEYLLSDDGLPEDTIELYLAKTYAPGGYAWVFPKGPGRANVGLGVHPSMAKKGTAREYLDRFIGDYFPKAKIGKLVAGGVSGTKPLKTMVGDGVLLVGEAGHQNNPLSGGGIMNALEGAEEAHTVLAAALHEDNLGGDFLRRYDKAWQDRNGHSIRKFAILRELFFTLDDKELNSFVAVLGKVVESRPGRITDYAEVFKAALKATPGVLWKATKTLW
jgi:digeranylgeranylglycerophospholipid reductase